MEDVTEATRACAYCRGSLENTADVERIVCSNCRAYLRKQLPDLCQPSLTANVDLIRRVGHMRLCSSLLARDAYEAKDHLRTQDYDAFLIGHRERIVAHQVRFADVLHYRAR